MCWFVSQRFKAVFGMMQEELVQSSAVTRDDSKMPYSLSHLCSPLLVVQ